MMGMDDALHGAWLHGAWVHGVDGNVVCWDDG